MKYSPIHVCVRLNVTPVEDVMQLRVTQNIRKSSQLQEEKPTRDEDSQELPSNQEWLRLHPGTPTLRGQTEYLGEELLFMWINAFVHMTRVNISIGSEAPQRRFSTKTYVVEGEFG